jgi:hypothetical protein
VGSVLAQPSGTLPDSLITPQESSVQSDTLWAIPCGPMVGTMFSGARVQILDTVASWAKITVEGWVPVRTALNYAPSDTIAPRESVVQEESAEFHQCEAITLKGTRCTRRAKKGSRYCWQHQNYDKR